MVGLIMNEAMQSSLTHSPGRSCMKYLTGCRHAASHNPRCLPSPSWPLTWARACVGARWPVVMQHTMAAGQCLWLWVCAIMGWIMFTFVKSGFQCLQNFLTAPSLLFPPDDGDSLRSVSSHTLGPGRRGWDWMGVGEGVRCGGQWVGSGCFLLHSGWQHTDKYVCV